MKININVGGILTKLLHIVICNILKVYIGVDISAFWQAQPCATYPVMGGMALFIQRDMLSICDSLFDG